MLKVKKMVVAGLIFCLLAALWTPVPLQAEPAGAVYFVALDGSDSNPGTEEAPFRTLEAARDAIRALKAGEGLPAGGVTVYLREGVYERLETFELTEEDSGTADAPIVYRSYPGETVRLSGGRVLDRADFVPVTESNVLRRIIDEAARSKVLQIDLRSLGIDDYGEMSRHGYWKANDISLTPPMELYVDGQGMTLARWPNDFTVQMGDILDPGPTVKDPDLHDRGGTFTYHYDRPKFWTEAEDIWLDGIFGYSWEWSYNKIAAIDTVNKTITLEYGEMSGLLKNWYPDFHFAQNLLEEIDAPGEYYIDREAGILYFLPNAAFLSGHGDVVVTMLKEPMIRTLTASHIRFEELFLEYGRDTAAVILGGNHVVIENCDISNFANGGVLINAPGRYAYDGVEGVRDGHDHAVISSHLHHIGGTAVTLHGGDRETLEPGNNRVENSHIHDFAYYHKAYNPGVLFSGVGNRASGNEIHDAPHPGIIIYGNDHVIEYNEIYDICKEFQDLGAIYMNAGAVPHERGNVVYRNYFHHIGEDRHGVEGVYPDNMTMGMRIEQNVFYRMGNDAIKSGTGSYIVAENNLFIDTYVPYDNYEMFMDRGPGNRVDRDYMPAWIELFEQHNNFEGTPYLEKYPELAHFFDEDRYFPTTNRFANNVIYNPTRPLSSQTNEHGARDVHNLLNYENNWVADRDPGFVDAASGDFRLAEDAVLFEHVPDFAPIPFEAIGTQGKVGVSHAPDTIPVQSLRLEDEIVVELGKTTPAAAAVVPWNATNRTILYTVDDPSVAEVDAQGNVTGVSTGMTVLRAVSSDNAEVSDTAVITVIEGDGVLYFTDFENGGNGWLVDANHAIVQDGAGNHWYRIVDGANSQSDKLFSNYVLDYRLRTPETFPEGASFIMYERNGASGSGYVQYKDTPEGSAWTLFDSNWQTLKKVTYNEKDLLPNSVYDIRMIARGAQISVFVDGQLRLQGEHAHHSESGKVGFYVEGFPYLEFDDIRFSLPRTAVEAVVVEPSAVRLTEGAQTLLRAGVLPEDAADRTVLWSSSDPGVAVVDADGFVTAVGRGEAVITARSAADPDIFATVSVTVSDVMHETDFENGGNGWLVDANHAIVQDGSGNHWYRIVDGASAKSPQEFSSYVLTYRLQVPEEVPDNARLVIYERDGAGGRGYVIYKKTAAGSSWSLADAEWNTLEENVFETDDLLPGHTYDIRLVANGPDVRLYVDGNLRLQAEHSDFSAKGQVGFYVEGFPYLMFDDIVFALDRIPVTGVELDRTEVTLEDGENVKLTAAVLPGGATTKAVIWSSSDPAVASVSDDGVVTAVSPGTALIRAAARDNASIFAEASVTVVEPDYPYVLLDEALRDAAGWSVSDAVYADVASGTVAVRGEGVYGYSGQAFGSELIRFRASFDEFGTGWYGFAVRSDRVGDPTWVNANKGYLIVIKADQIELQSWKPGQTMISIIPNDAVFAGREHLIEIGAVNVNSGVRFLFRVDGDTVFNFLDTDAGNPIAPAGYLNVYRYVPEGNEIVLKPARTFESIRLDADRYELAVGESIPVVVEAVYADGYAENTSPADGVVFATVHPEVAAVSGSGVLSGISEGVTRLIVTYNGVSAEAPVTVVASRGDGEDPGEDPGEEPGDGSGKEPGDGSGGGSGKDPGDGSGDEPGSGPGEKPGGDPDNGSGDGSGNGSDAGSGQDALNQPELEVDADGAVTLGGAAVEIVRRTAEDGSIVTEAVIDAEALVRAFELLAQTPEGERKVIVRIDSGSGEAIVSVPAAAFAEAGAGTAGTVLTIATEGAEYDLPIGLIDAAALAEAWDVGPDGLKIVVSIAPLSGETLQAIRTSAAAQGMTLKGTPMEFKLAVEAGDRTEEIRDFGAAYVTRTIHVAETLEPDHATVVLYNAATGSMRFVPARFIDKDGTTRVVLKRTGNSIYAVMLSNASFADMENHWAQASVELLAAKRLLNGDSAASFAPDRRVTRAEFAAMLVRALGLEPDTAATAAFSDAAEGSWYAGEIGAATKHGIVTGLPGGTFHPNGGVTRQEMAVMAARALDFVGVQAEGAGAEARAGSNSGTGLFADRGEIAGWAEPGVRRAVAAGIMHGRPDGSFAPAAEATRAEAAVVLHRLLKVLAFID